jgi:hypothetical protein
MLSTIIIIIIIIIIRNVWNYTSTPPIWLHGVDREIIIIIIILNLRTL